MNAEDERNCDYTGSQYRPDLYKSINTDHSNFKYSQLKNAIDADTNDTTITTKSPAPQSTAVFQSTKTPLKPNTTTTLYQNENSKMEMSTVRITSDKTNISTELNEQSLDAYLKELFDNQMTEKTFSCERYYFSTKLCAFKNCVVNTNAFHLLILELLRWCY